MTICCTYKIQERPKGRRYVALQLSRQHKALCKARAKRYHIVISLSGVSLEAGFRLFDQFDMQYPLVTSRTGS